MTPFMSLLLPIVVSAVAVFVLTLIIHMTPWHRRDYIKLPDEDGVMQRSQVVHDLQERRGLPAVRPGHRVDLLDDVAEDEACMSRGPFMLDLGSIARVFTDVPAAIPVERRPVNHAPPPRDPSPLEGPSTRGTEPAMG